MIQTIKFGEHEISVLVKSHSLDGGLSKIMTFTIYPEEILKLKEENTVIINLINMIMDRISQDKSGISTVSFRTKEGISVRSIERVQTDFRKSINALGLIPDVDVSTIIEHTDSYPYVIGDLSITDKTARFETTQHHVYILEIPITDVKAVMADVKAREKVKEDVSDDA